VGLKRSQKSTGGVLRYVEIFGVRKMIEALILSTSAFMLVAAIIGLIALMIVAIKVRLNIQ